MNLKDTFWMSWHWTIPRRFRKKIIPQITKHCENLKVEISFCFLFSAWDLEAIGTFSRARLASLTCSILVCKSIDFGKRIDFGVGGCTSTTALYPMVSWQVGTPMDLFMMSNWRYHLGPTSTVITMTFPCSKILIHLSFHCWWMREHGHHIVDVGLIPATGYLNHQTGWILSINSMGFPSWRKWCYCWRRWKILHHLVGCII